MSVVRSFQGDQSIKDKYLTRVAARRENGQFVQGVCWRDGSGCSELGIPEWLAHLEDMIFKHLPLEQAVLWPERFLRAIPVGADLSLVRHRFVLWLLVDSGLLDRSRPEVAKVIDTVADLHRSVLAGSPPSYQEWSAADSVAFSLSASSASSALSVAWASLSASSVAWAAAWSAQSAQSSSVAWELMAARLEELLRDSEVRE